MVGHILLIEIRTVDSIGITFKNQRTIEKIRSQVRSDAIVKANQIALCVSLVRPEDLIEIGQLDFCLDAVAHFRNGSASWRIRWLLPTEWKRIFEDACRGINVVTKSQKYGTP